MVLQVLANAGQVLDDVDSKAAKRLRLPDAPVAQWAGSGKTQVTRQDRASCGLDISNE